MNNKQLPERVQKTLVLAEELQRKAEQIITRQERGKMDEIAGMVTVAANKSAVTMITDQSFRSKNPSRSVDQLIYILRNQGVPSFFGIFHRFFMLLFILVGKVIPRLVYPLIQAGLYRETLQVIAPGEPHLLKAALARIRRERVRVNLNSLGEMLLGENDALKRLDSYRDLLRKPEVEVISVKISTIYSQISLLAREYTLEKLFPRLLSLYQESMANHFIRSDGSRSPKFIYLDMEEYQHLRITVDLFIRTLNHPDLKGYGGGIVLQAYIPDSYPIQRQITDWAKKRVASGGHPITIRIVKGANLEMERVVSSAAGYPLPIFSKKAEADANYKRMLQFGLIPDNIAAVRIGVATHNLFEVSYALVLAEENQVLDAVQFEMLEGMTNHQKRALLPYCRNMLLYVPTVPRTGFLNAIGYLIRRLDENSGEENFLRHTFGLRVGDDAWKKLAGQFIHSYSLIPQITEHPRRTQNRNLAICKESPLLPGLNNFDNEPDTDFALLENITWGEAILEKWGKTSYPIPVPIQIAGREILPDNREQFTMNDPSRPEITVTRYSLPTPEEVEEALACADQDPAGWRKKTYAERYEILTNAAQEVRKSRADLVGAALAECGKILPQSDPEISEAVDFIEFYLRTAEHWENLAADLSAPPSSLGTVAVIPPWNFPIAIPCGGVAAGLASGNNVIIKPAPQSTLCAWLICQCFWRAGVPREALQFLPGSGEVGSILTKDTRVKAVVFTGGTATAQNIIRNNPRTHLLAETGGKNAIIVTALSDREQAVKNVAASAFGHAGQKCSAASLLILEGEVYDDPDFRNTLIDAAQSLDVGSAWETSTKVNPLIRKPNPALQYGLTKLEPGEEWALLPRMMDGNPQLWSPGIRWGVKPGSPSHLTEFFGPVLSVMRARDLTEAIDMVNQTGYGLTSGLETLDEREKEVWIEKIKGGNLYINRPITGAIVLRQPFGGIGKSAFGPGIKAGGPNYLVQFYRFSPAPVTAYDESAPPTLTTLADPFHLLGDFLPEEECQELAAFINDVKENLKAEFNAVHDHFRLVGQDNFRRYRPIHRLTVRLHPDDSRSGILIRIIAAQLSGCRITVSFPTQFPDVKIAFLKKGLVFMKDAFLKQSDEELISGMGETDRIRYDGWEKIPYSVLLAGAENHVYIAGTGISRMARLELLWYFYEQSISHDYHRYGNLGTRAGETRRPVL